MDGLVGVAGAFESTTVLYGHIYIWAFLQVGTFDPGPLSMSLWDVSMQTLPTCCCQNIVSLMCLQDITYAIHTCA